MGRLRELSGMARGPKPRVWTGQPEEAALGSGGAWETHRAGGV